MIRQLEQTDAQEYLLLRRESLVNAPHAFLASPEDDMASSIDAVRDMLQRAPDSVIIGAFQPELVGAAGIFRDRHLKSRHKAIVWGMYVRSAHRGRGLASALLEAAVNHARGLPDITCVQLCVSAEAPEARRVYERAGFKVWGIEPAAMTLDGRELDEYHLTLRL